MARRLANRLAVLEQDPRLIVLAAGRDAELPEMEVVEASYPDPASMRRALAGVHTFFMIPVHEASDRVQRHVAAVDAAVAAGTGAGLVLYGLELLGVIVYGAPMAGNFWRAWSAWVIYVGVTVTVSMLTSNSRNTDR